MIIQLITKINRYYGAPCLLLAPFSSSLLSGPLLVLFVDFFREGKLLQHYTTSTEQGIGILFYKYDLCFDKLLTIFNGRLSL